MISFWAQVAGLLIAAGGLFAKPLIQRRLQKRNEFKYLIRELVDIHRHLGQNEIVLQLVIKGRQVPSPMHINKLKIPDSSAIFSIETLRLADFKYSSRLYELRLKLRNLNIEIDDLLEFADPKYDESGFWNLAEYHLKKIALIRRVLGDELQILVRMRKGARRQESAGLRYIITRPQLRRPESSNSKKELSAPVRSGTNQSDDGDMQSPKVDDDNQREIAEDRLPSHGTGTNTSEI